MLESFKQFLSSKGNVNEKYLPFYLKWLTEGFRFLAIPLSQPITNEQKSQFLKHLSKSHEDWQVNQADHALRLYSYFLSPDYEKFFFNISCPNRFTNMQVEADTTMQGMWE